MKLCFNRRLQAWQKFIFLTLAVLSARGNETSTGGEGPGPLVTRWATDVNPTNVWPEYPRPQMVRADWENLNGLWDYAITSETAKTPDNFDGKILVPFPLESRLSGVRTNLDEHKRLWYRRSFGVPESWRDRRVRLHFGAVDWACKVWVNGRVIGQHQGGYDAFTFDITDALAWRGDEQIVVAVSDPTEGDQPRGKQSRKPEGIFYTSSSGIWQTVWLEPVAAIGIEELKLVPDVDANVLRLRVAANSLTGDLRVEAVALDGEKEIGRVSGSPNAELVLTLPSPHLWSPENPFLYDLKVTLRSNDNEVDQVTSYFGMRKISVGKDEQGVTRMALNNKFIFQVGTLDQGFWPDGIYTAPTDAALRSDIEFLKRAGFNLTRKHVKVEPDRWYYWCDKLGLLVWQDMPSADNSTAAARRNFESELHRMVAGLGNHPSLIVWVLFNEGWGQYDTEALSDWLKKLDPSRLVDDASGWTDMRAGDLIDMHNYPGPSTPATEPHRAAVLGETGGYGFIVTNHVWSASHWGYVMLTNASSLLDHYVDGMKQVWRLHTARGLSAVIYTQTSDVETECNGLLSFDRAVSKIDPEILSAANRGIALHLPAKVVLPNALFGRPAWRYTTVKPVGEWRQVDYKETNWRDGISGFGTPNTPGIFMNTGWNTDNIWLRREFTIEEADIPKIKFQLFHDEDVEIYLNGVLALETQGFATDYDNYEIPKEVLATLHAGKNIIAVHCHQSTGGQGVDVGIVVPDSTK